MKRRKLLTITLLGIGLIAIVAVLLTQFILKQDQITRPTVPPSVAAIRPDWQSTILLPTYIPSCLGYKPNGATIQSDPDARGGKVLSIQLDPVVSADCSLSPGSDVVIAQAPALASLTGKVLTVSEGRMQFARLANTNANGQSEVTLQWHCLVDVMCRLTGTTGTQITSDVLSRMADSFEIIKPAS